MTIEKPIVVAFVTLVAAACSEDGDAPGMPSVPVAGSSASMAPPVSTPPASTPPASAPELQPTAADSESFTRALRLEIGVEWPATIGLDAGSGKVIVYAKVTYRKSGDQWLTESRPCGTDLPVITTSLLVNNLKSVNRIPSAAFDSPSMPVGQGTITTSAGMLNIDTSGVFGVELPDPSAAWPAAEALEPVDHDGDGKPGVTAIPEEGDGYIIPPLNVAQDRTADQVYVAARVRYTLHAPEQPYAELSSGMATIGGFDYTIVGCHATDGVECVASETRFLARAAPAFTVAASAPWMQREVPSDATCARIQAAFIP